MFHRHEIRMISDGIKSFIPGLKDVGLRGTVMSDIRLPARYFYSVYLRHLVMAYKNGISTKIDSIAELGPGDSLGIGLAALLSGASKYYAFDIMKFASNNYNFEVFDELVELFNKRESIPDTSEFPAITPILESHQFPRHILTDKLLDEALKKERIDSIKSALKNLSWSDDEKIKIAYVVPWYDSTFLGNETIDIIMSQAVLEHVDKLPAMYEAMYAWLKPGGWISHSIDFRSHGLSGTWNGHWAYSDFKWWLIRGRRPYLLNRKPHSAHINHIRAVGFDLICDLRSENESIYTQKQLASKFRNISNEDLITSTAFVQAVKK